MNKETLFHDLQTYLKDLPHSFAHYSIYYTKDNEKPNADADNSNVHLVYWRKYGTDYCVIEETHPSQELSLDVIRDILTQYTYIDLSIESDNIVLNEVFHKAIGEIEIIHNTLWDDEDLVLFELS